MRQPQGYLEMLAMGRYLSCSLIDALRPSSSITCTTASSA